MTTRTFRITSILETALMPQHMVLTDESHTHRGHMGAKEHAKSLGEGGRHINPTETHFALEISAVALHGLSRVAQHQKIYNLVADEFKTGLHSLRISVV